MFSKFPKEDGNYESCFRHFFGKPSIKMALMMFFIDVGNIQLSALN